jgi:integrase-like protein
VHEPAACYSATEVGFVWRSRRPQARIAAPSWDSLAPDGRRHAEAVRVGRPVLAASMTDRHHAILGQPVPSASVCTVSTNRRRTALLRSGNFRRRFFDPAAMAAGLDDLRPHDLRHTAASLLVASGANVKAVQRMLGHASAAMTLDVYFGLFDDEPRRPR